MKPGELFTFPTPVYPRQYKSGLFMNYLLRDIWISDLISRNKFMMMKHLMNCVSSTNLLKDVEKIGFDCIVERIFDISKNINLIRPEKTIIKSKGVYTNANKNRRHRKISK